MDIFFEGKFYNPTKGNLNLFDVFDEIINYIKDKPLCEYELIVGCDSSSGDDPEFPLAIVILRKGQGGRFFIKKIKYSETKKFYNIPQRILQEVMLSCQLALYLRENLNERIKSKFPNLKFQFQYIHADIGERGQTKDMIKEVIGLIRGNGFEPIIKPESFVASSVADRFSD